MPTPIPLPLRQQIWLRHQQGQEAMIIAHALQLCPRTVQHLVQRLQARGRDGLQTDYHAPTAAPLAAEPLRHEALFLRQEHPTWGAGFIRIRLQARHPSLPLPSERTLQRWFRQVRQPAAPPGRQPAGPRLRADRPHAVWQVDACERIRLAGGQLVSWLRGVDEFTGAVLGTRVFPPGVLDSGAGPPDATLLTAAVWPLGTAGGAALR
jgi:hypothetical protein